MQKDQLIILLQKYIAGHTTEVEGKELASFMEKDANQELVIEALGEMAVTHPHDAEFDAERFLPLLDVITGADKQYLSPLPVRRMPFLRHWWAAASIILLLATGTYFWFRQSQPALLSNYQQIDIEPGREGAILTLADGRQVALDSLAGGVIALQNGAEIKLKNGQLVYDLTKEPAGEMVYNTITTPKGRQFSLRLPDGSRVWLNAASSLRYPTAFTGKERKVEVTGEAYFEVAKNTIMPFRVNVNDQVEIEVLGTQFNVNAFKDEGSINTTLLEGRVKLAVIGTKFSAGSTKTRPVTEVILTPGQQAQLFVGSKTSSGIAVMDNADIDGAVAWKNGLFNFQGNNLQEVMRQLERWYDIEVVYEKEVPDIRFGGKLKRDISLAGLLRVLKASDVNFRIEEGRRLVVMP